MSQPIRAVYDHGSLRLLDEVELAEGQEVHVVILSEKERVRAALGEHGSRCPRTGSRGGHAWGCELGTRTRCPGPPGVTPLRADGGHLAFCLHAKYFD